MRTFAIILLLASLFAASCGEPPMPPSDEEMIRHFATHEAEWETADSVYVSLVMPYYSHGIVDAGTSKSFIYDPGLESRRNIRITEHGDLNEIYRRTYNDTTLYKPVREGWYIELDHSR